MTSIGALKHPDSISGINPPSRTTEDRATVNELALPYTPVPDDPPNVSDTISASDLAAAGSTARQLIENVTDLLPFFFPLPDI